MTSPVDGLSTVLVVAFCVSGVITALSIPIARASRIIDVPNPLKIHSQGMPRLGGLGIFAGFATGVLALAGELRVYLIGALLMFLVGVADDRWNISPVQKLTGQAVAGLVLWAAISTASPGWQGLLYGFLGFLLAVILANAINLIDGMDGLAGGNAFLIFVGLGILAMLHGSRGDVMFVAAAAVLGFLPFNFPRAKVFMGDSGSLLIGYVIAYAMVQLLEKGLALFLCAVIVAIVPVFDLCLGVVRRAFAGKHIFAADRGHFYDRINQLIENKTKTVFVTYVCTALFSAIAFWASLGGLALSSAALFTTCAVLALIAGSMGWFRPAESGQPSQ